MKRLLLLACLCLSAAVPAQANSYYFDGNALIKLCEGQIRDRDFCNGYVIAAYDSNTIYFEEDVFCLPAAATGNQVAAVAIKFMQEHPEKLHLSAAALVIQSLVEAFPC